LRDSAIVQQIAERAMEEAAKHRCNALLEIGPGKGALTLSLIEILNRPSKSGDSPEIKTFLLVERDRELAKHWQEVAQEMAPKNSEISFQFQVQSSDFLDLAENLWLQSSPLAVVSNLPYSAGTAILNRLARQGEKIPVMILMFQAEVAKRLRAEPSTSSRGSLSVWIQNLWDVQKFLEVPPRAFSPPPEVNSEVVVLTRRETPQIEGTIDSSGGALWEQLLKTCFSQRRKMLRSILNARSPWHKALELSGVDPTKRAEALDWQEWRQLFKAALVR